jgi:hypothetical protein
MRARFALPTRRVLDASGQAGPHEAAAPEEIESEMLGAGAGAAFEQPAGTR